MFTTSRNYIFGHRLPVMAFFVAVIFGGVAEAQTGNYNGFNYSTTFGIITITGYTGPGGSISTPGIINGQAVTIIGPSAFQGNTTLTDVAINYNTTTISASAFQGCTGLKRIEIPNDVSDIGSFAFAGCTGLKSATISMSISSIGQDAFKNCTNLISVFFVPPPSTPAKAPTMGTGVFSNVHSGFSVYYGSGASGFTSPTWTDSAGDTYPASVEPPYITANDGNGGLMITRYTGSGGDLVIPATINGLPVTRIDWAAFLITNPTGLTSVVIPSSVTSIGDSAFYTCTNLASVTIPNSVKSIETGAFGDCTSLTNVTIPASVTSIGQDAFVQCTSLTAITVNAANTAYRSSADGVLFNFNKTALIECPGAKAGSYTVPASVTTIGNDAFEYCANLTNVTFPNGVTSIGTMAFGFCSGLTTMTIPGSVLTIGGNTFYSCSSLASVTLSNGLTSISDTLFVGCSSLTTITIPSTVTSVGQNAFHGCKALKSAMFQGNAPTMGASVFTLVANGFTVYYYDGATGFATPTWKTNSGEFYPAVALVTFSRWKGKYPTLGDPDPNHTPQKDGVSTLLKYFFNIDPTRPMTAADRAALPVARIDSGNFFEVPYLVLTYREYGLATGFTVKLQTSTDLKTWATVTPDLSQLVGIDEVTRDPIKEVGVKTNSATQLFIRLNVAIP